MLRETPIVSIVLATHNRRDVVLNTLEQIHRCGLERRSFEVIAVDNASSDKTPEAIGGRVDRLIRLKRNRGSCAKAFGVDEARGRFVVFVDDDSSPTPGSLSRMLERFREDPTLGAAGFTVRLPNGEREGAALAGVFVGCGVGFRAEALRQVGGLDRTLFMQAEEYDLSFRLAAAGWRVEVFDDLHVSHLKTEHARRGERTTYFDVRNNLRVIARYLPAPHHTVYREDCVRRYGWFAARQGHDQAFERGARTGRRRGWLERPRYRRWRLSGEVFERFFRLHEIEQRMMSLSREGVRRIVLADLGKNIYPYLRGAGCAGLQVLAVGDDRFASPGRTYRGAPILPLIAALDQPCDAVVIANTAPVHAARTRMQLSALTRRPIHDWFGDRSEPGAGIICPPPRSTSDDNAVALGVL